MTAAVHRVDERLPLPRLAALGLQHALVMYAGAVAVPLIGGRALEPFPPVVTAIIIAVIGITLTRVGVGRAMGGPPNLAQNVDVPQLVAMVDAANAGGRQMPHALQPLPEWGIPLSANAAVALDLSVNGGKGNTEDAVAAARMAEAH